MRGQLTPIAAATSLAFAAVMTGCAAPKPETVAASSPPPVSAAAPARRTATPRSLHDDHIIPGSNALFAAEAEEPADEAGWLAVAAGAERVIAGANELALLADGRPEWEAFAKEVATHAALSAKAAAARDPDALLMADGDMMTGCTGCHQAYRKTTP